MFYEEVFTFFKANVVLLVREIINSSLSILTDTSVLGPIWYLADNGFEVYIYYKQLREE